MFRSRGRSLLVSLAILAAVPILGIVGCSDSGVKKITVSGTITYKGQPLSSGMLTAIGSTNNEVTSASIQTDGSFILTDVIPGPVKIGIIPTPVSMSSSNGKAAPKRPPVNLPAKFSNPQQSGVEVTIADNGNPLKIELN
ncbi:hypothetical protein [Tuwongella immobilis]|uniref:Carboxypeptidase regulatory-like domain-containing protein n=1 Tax=Tuwongella immobilis TaxID=692036 RepID=A0A6C2YW16_9BACT|nr:hypothetical protein [Tuwongella immobilis]VIP05567.1 Uncharacterized protein OS=Planctomyces brasiliensis (strain ATCC 49424 / DSM 5305 / JCM 21570 / NBRC 103401 / IFAM 1448) GN=Plabr_0918 PE=4 SV=1 [Tuwongella immobilis]VTS08489.1 Uncharacterized protein OS=Planctomyces brasiliensis (strain ATCC 49424 / DSM 5305 / JCM 21570 / NBRC 103401 / IFAM 1448) GN=Plabr_0918 PE=4 SV=1 [Tuwongella immobilis]